MTASTVQGKAANPDPGGLPPGQPSIGVEKHGANYINYELTHRPGRPLVVVFSGVDSRPARCSTSYYRYHRQLNCSVLHIADTFGAHGNYLICLGRNKSVVEAVASIVRRTMAATATPLDQVYLIGSSKGGTTALCLSMVLGGGHCLVAEPQVRLGKFLFTDDWKNDPVAVSISYVMMGRMNIRDAEFLDKLVLSFFWQHLPSYKGRIEIMFGNGTSYLRDHVRLIPQAIAGAGREAEICTLHEVDTQTHDAIARPFDAWIRGRLGFEETAGEPSDHLEDDPQDSETG